MKKCEIWCVFRNETSKGNLLVYCKTLIFIQASKLEKLECGSFLGASYLKTDGKKWAKKSYCQRFLGMMCA